MDGWNQTGGILERKPDDNASWPQPSLEAQCIYMKEGPPT